MSSAAATVPENQPASPASSKRLLILIAAPILLAVVAAGLWFTGILPSLLGTGHKESVQSSAEAAPIYVDLPEMVANLNGNSHRPSYLKLNARLEVARQQDVERVKQAMPRLQDLFQSFLREMRPEELRGSASTYRLREELIARANAVTTPARVTNVLFIQLLVQ
ncbi:MAG: flagellar basal body-associated FliL family protein [Acetobacteraceae bacterium]|nr:flagellar basal body-associated FliL family protein [Acetobacteraceae bacterium]